MIIALVSLPPLLRLREAHQVAPARPMTTTASVIDRLRARIGKDGPSTEATVEAGHVRGFVQAIGDPNPRWVKEAPPTFLVALAPASVHLAEAEEYGKGWLNGLLAAGLEYANSTSLTWAVDPAGAAHTSAGPPTRSQ